MNRENVEDSLKLELIDNGRTSNINQHSVMVIWLIKNQNQFYFLLLPKNYQLQKPGDKIN